MLRVENLSVNYGKIEALRGVNLEIKSGEIVALVGANGAGKSTLLRAISGLILPLSGEIFYKSQNITKLSSKKRVQLGIAQVPEGRGLFGELRVEDNLLLGAYTRRDKDKIMSDLKKIYELFPTLKEKSKEFASNLSGGQQQMVALGRALMSRPKLLLLDEPSMGLAPVVVEEIFGVIKSLQKEGSTIFLVEQNASLALNFSNRAYILENGEIVGEGASKELLQDSSIIDAYLGR